MSATEVRKAYQDLFVDFKLAADKVLVVERVEDATEEERQFWRRTFCRCLFAWLEAWLSYIRGEYLPGRHAEGVFADDPEKSEYFNSLFAVTSLHEMAINERGECERRKRKIGLRPHMKAAIRMMYLLHGKGKADADALFSSERWGAFVRSVALRDGLMHPHRADDIIVSEDAFMDTLAAVEFGTEMMAFTTEHKAETSERLNKEVERLNKKREDTLLQSEKSKERASFYERLHQDFREHKPFLLAIVEQTGDKATGRLVKELPTADHPAKTERIQVVVLPASDKTTFILRTPDAPWVDEP
jgi:hypothetical protein